MRAGHPEYHPLRFSVRMLLANLLLMASAVPSWAYTYSQVGVDSNFLIDEGNVYFVQSDGSLTVLKLETGTVIARKEGQYDGTLLRVADGILQLTYGEIAMLDKATLEPAWRTRCHYDPTIVGDRLVSYDGCGLVECRNVNNGAVVWSYDLPGALDITVKKGRVLVFRSAIYDGADGVPAVVLLELPSGRELLHKTTPEGVHCIEAYFDGDRIYLASGRYTGSYTPSTSAYDQGRPSARFETLLVWDLDGNEVESLPVTPQVISAYLLGDEHLRGDSPFMLAGKAFARGEVWSDIDSIPPRALGRGKEVRKGSSADFERDGGTTRFDLGTGALTVTARTRVTLESNAKRWTGTIPYLGSRGEIVVVAEAQDRILLGSNLGHVECIYADTGKSRWMYLFPTMRHTMSYSSRGMPPYMATAAAIYQRENTNRNVESGLIVNGSVENSTPTIILDPNPADPYRNLPLYCAIAWVGAAVAPTVSGLLFRVSRKGVLGGRVLAAANLALTLLAVAIFIFFGNVSISSTLALRAGVLIPLIGAIAYSMACATQGHAIFGTLCLLASIGIVVIVFPAIISL